MAEGSRAYRRIGTRDAAAQRLARTLAATERDITEGRNDRYLFPNLWGGRWVGLFGGSRFDPRHQPRGGALDLQWM